MMQAMHPSSEHRYWTRNDLGARQMDPGKMLGLEEDVVISVVIFSQKSQCKIIIIHIPVDPSSSFLSR